MVIAVVLAVILLIALVVIWAVIGKDSSEKQEETSVHVVTGGWNPPAEKPKEPEKIYFKGDLWSNRDEKQTGTPGNGWNEQPVTPKVPGAESAGIVMLYEEPSGLNHRWQCRCCGAANELSAQTCEVCMHPRT